jgi:hypothetical protein
MAAMMSLRTVIFQENHPIMLSGNFGETFKLRCKIANVSNTWCSNGSPMAVYVRRTVKSAFSGSITIFGVFH